MWNCYLKVGVSVMGAKVSPELNGFSFYTVVHSNTIYFHFPILGYDWSLDSGFQNPVQELERYLGG